MACFRGKLTIHSKRHADGIAHQHNLRQFTNCASGSQAWGNRCVSSFFRCEALGILYVARRVP
eukprot:8933023-Lingulodinium_polyedra.AAC.1